MAGRAPSRGERNLQTIVDAIRQLFEGRSNAVGSVTLTANAATTVVAGPNIGLDSSIFLFPKTSNAAAAVATTFVLAANVVRGQFTISHANNAQTDKSFFWVALG
jgi:hypothetical protein